ARHVSSMISLPVTKPPLRPASDVVVANRSIKRDILGAPSEHLLNRRSLREVFGSWRWFLIPAIICARVFSTRGHSRGISSRGKMRRLALSLILLLFCDAVAAEQVAPSKTAAPTVPPKPVPKPAPKKPAPKSPIARDLFGAAAAPAPLAARAIGSYAKGCLAGGVSLPINGPDWQVMRLSRNRNWGTPQLLDFLERLSSAARAFDGGPGLLIGDMSQPRGGPMLTGHTSHQVGLDAD